MFTKILIWEGKLSIIIRLLLGTHECNNNTADLSTNRGGEKVFLELKSTLDSNPSIRYWKIYRLGTIFTKYNTHLIATTSKQDRHFALTTR